MTEETATTSTTSSSVACKMNRMILEMKLNENDTQFEYEDDIINYFDDDEVVVVVVEDENEDEDELELKTRNSSTSDSGCSSSTSFNDKPSASTNLVKSTRSILSGISGRAKYDDEQPKNLILNKIFNSISIQTVNYGDDCGFICNKHIQSNKSRLMHNNNNNNDDDDGDYDDNKQLINKYYFGLADGVSANRLRGYDAKLFPTALLNACTFYIDKLAASSVLQFVKTSFNSDIEIVSAKKEEEAKDEEEEEEDDDDDWNDEDWNVQPVEIVEEVVENEIEENDCANLNNILINAHNLVQEQQVYGSSTVCLFSLEFYDMHEYGLLSTCNLGDSGYMLIRNSKVMFKSQTQSHRYNAPYQLGCTPPELLDHDLYRDKPDDSICQSHQIKSGDYLIISSDGLFDNLYEDEIALIIQEHIDLFQSQNNNNFKITSDLLDSACQLLVNKASKAGIKKDDILIMLIYIE